MAVQITRRDVGPVTILDLKGKLAADGAETLSSTLDGLIEEGRMELVLNLGEISFVDSGALGTLLSRRGDVRQQGGALKLLNTTSRISDLLVTTKLETVFDTFSSEAEVVKSFETRASTAETMTGG